MALPPNKFFMFSEAGDVGASAATDVFGTNDAQTLNIAAAARTLLDPSFARGNDIINIAGVAALYTMSVVDSHLVLTGSNGADIRIPIGVEGLSINFADAEDRVLLFDPDAGENGEFLLGDQVIPSDGSSIGVTPGDGGGGDPDPEPNPGDEIMLKIGNEPAIGTDGDDTFIGWRGVNADGATANTFNTGDIVRGGLGNDLLDVEMQDATALGAGPSSTTRPGRIDSVETIRVNAQFADGPTDTTHDYDETPYGIALGVELNAQAVFGTYNWQSYFSDTSLTIYNVNTLPAGTGLDDEDQAQLTEVLTVRMDHTGPASPHDDAANFTVLLDNDYLLRQGEVISGSTLNIEIMDLDAALDGDDATGPLEDNVIGRIVFELGSETITLDFGTEANTYEELLLDVQAALAADPRLVNLSASIGGDFLASDTDDDPGGSAFGKTIVITNSGPEPMTAISMVASAAAPAGKDYHTNFYSGQPGVEGSLITINVELDKVGRGGDGGYLTAGGMAVVGSEHWYDTLIDNTWKGGLIARPGIEQFNVKVEGSSSEPSSLAGLQSTHNALQEVYVTNPGSTAKLTIGNTQTHAVNSINGALFPEWYGEEYDDYLDIDWFGPDLTTVKNAAIKDVRVFDASQFTADSEVHAYFSDENVAKYMDLKDYQGNAAADNMNAEWSFGQGDNLLNVNFSKSNLAVLGTATREDFTFSADMGAGDDHVQIQIGDGQGLDFYDSEWQDDRGRWDQSSPVVDPTMDATVSHWYANHAINSFDEYARTGKMQITIETGTGNDVVELWGSSAALVSTGAGNDTVYTDNSGESSSLYNEGHATWSFNSAHSLNVNDTLTIEPGTTGVRVANLGLVVTFQGVESHVSLVAGTHTNSGAVVTDLTINQAIKEAINNDPVLNKLLVAEDGPGRTLIVRSLIDGEHLDSDLAVNLLSTAGLTPQQIATGAILFSDSSVAAGGIGFATTGAALTAPFDHDGNPATQPVTNRYDAQLANDNGDTLTGWDSWNVNNNVVEGGAGNDVIVLSSNGVGYYEGSSVETLVLNKGFGDDTVVNFTAAVTEGSQPEIQSVTFTGEADRDGNVNLSIAGLGDIDVEITEGDTAATIAGNVAEAIEDELGGDVVVTVSGTTVTVTATTPGVNWPTAVATISAVPPISEEHTLTFTNDQLSPANVVIDFDDDFLGLVTVPVGTTPGTDQTAADIAVLVAQAINDAYGDDVAVVSGTDVVITYPGDDAYDTPIVGVVSANEVTLDVAVEQTNEAEPYDVSAAVAAVQDGLPGLPGWDIFDVTGILGGPVVEVLNDMPVTNTSGGLDLGIDDTNTDTDGATINEAAAISYAVHNDNIVYITDTVSVNDQVGATELARITTIAKAADNAATTAATDSIVITVNADNVGTFYLVHNGVAVNDATVERLGSIELATYDVSGKEAIGNWDWMSLSNFTTLTANTVTDTFHIA